MKVPLLIAVCVLFCWSWTQGTVIPNNPLLISLVGDVYDNQTLTSFVEFALKYEKVYPDEKEMIYRLGVFKLGVAAAAKMDEESRKLGGARYGITKFSDLTIHEFRDRYTMRHMPPLPHEKLYSPKYNPDFSNSTWYTDLLKKYPGGPPAKADWNNRPNTVTGVYNQGNCGSCWTFSATENHESRFALQHNQNVQSLSPQQIVDCDDSSKYGCNGGWPYQAWEYIQSQGGQDTWSCYPYVGYAQGCRWNGGCNAAGIVSWSWINRGNEPAMQEWLWGNAPISILVDASQWMYYNGGVVLSSACQQNIDHAVLITGWNMNSNPPSWNVRNSWGSNWGEGGYISLQYNANTCNLAAYSASCHTCNNCPPIAE